jgi:hypothetical protein
MATNWASLKLGTFGTVVEDLDDVRQCLTIIVLTPKGSDPHRPDFGTDIRPWLDAPLPLAAPRMVADVVTAIETWEPRVEVDQVQVRRGDGPGHLVVAITVRIRETGQPLTVEVPLAA